MGDGEKEEEKRRPGVSKFYYWGKSPPKFKQVQKGFVNGEQMKYYLVQLAFRTAKVGAIVMVFLLFFAKI
jgi:hypothetical protein